jgi:hypothetical protein
MRVKVMDSLCDFQVEVSQYRLRIEQIIEQL